MTLEYWHGERLLWAETDEDREVILLTIGCHQFRRDEVIRFASIVPPAMESPV